MSNYDRTVTEKLFLRFLQVQDRLDARFPGFCNSKAGKLWQKAKYHYVGNIWNQYAYTRKGRMTARTAGTTLFWTLFALLWGVVLPVSLCIYAIWGLT
jgi:hypothetical protein